MPIKLFMSELKKRPVSGHRDGSWGRTTKSLIRPLGIGAISAALLATGVMSLGSGASAATKVKRLTPVTVGMNNGNIVDWEEYAAYTQQFFQDNGLAVTFVNSTSSVTQLAAVSSG